MSFWKLSEKPSAVTSTPKKWVSECCAAIGFMASPRRKPTPMTASQSALTMAVTFGVNSLGSFDSASLVVMP